MSGKIAKSNIYRNTEYCSTCPFLDNGERMTLREGRVDSIKKDLIETGGSFNCHKTVYRLDSNLEFTEKEQPLKMCYGAYMYLKENGKQNQVMQVAERLLGSD